jgi:hypothetical protein
MQLPPSPPPQGLGNVPECGELPVAQEPSLRVDGAFPLGHEPGQARTGRAGGHQ